MNTTILCQIKRAENPYYIKDVDLKIHSIEELCYYLQNNLPLIDLSFFSMQLLDWLEGELGTVRLAGELQHVLRENPDPQLPDLILPIMREAGWLSVEEEKEMRENLRGRDAQPITVRLKEKADALVSYKKYGQAIRTYDTLLQYKQAEKMGSSFLGAVWYNRGVAHARLFQYAEATACMRHAQDALHTMQTLKGLLFCVRKLEGEEAFLEEARRQEVDPATTEQLAIEIESTPEAAPPEEPEAALEGWIREYRRETRL